MPYQGQIPGIGDTGIYGGDFTAGVDLGYSPWSPPLSTVELPGDPYGYADVVHGGTGDTNQLAPGYQFAPQPEPPFNPSEPWPYVEPLPPAVGAPIYDPTPGAGGEGYPEPYTPPPAKPQPPPRGVIIEGEVAPPAGPAQHDTSSVWSIAERIAGGLIGRVIGRVIEGPWGAVIEEVITPEALPGEPDMRGIPSPIQFPSAPRPVSSNPAAPATAPAPRPPRPTLPPVPQLPSMSVPKPDIGASTWPSHSPAPTPATPPSSPSAPPLPSPTTTTAPQPVTSSQPGPQSSAQPASSAPPSKQWQFDPLPAWLADAIASRSPARSPSPTPQPLTPPTPQPTNVPQPASVTAPQPISVPSTATGSAAPPLTPIRPAAVESPPDGPSCETGPQRKARQKQQRESCERFITITIPRHKRRVCAADAGKYIGRKLGKAIGRAVGRVVRGKPLIAETRARKGSRRKEESPIRVGRRGSSIELPGGVGIEIPKQMRPRGLPRIPRL